MFVLFTIMVLLPEWLVLVRAVPEMYAKNAGIIGGMQGARNEPKPAKAATANVTSANKLVIEIHGKNISNKLFLSSITGLLHALFGNPPWVL